MAGTVLEYCHFKPFQSDIFPLSTAVMMCRLAPDVSAAMVKDRCVRINVFVVALYSSIGMACFE